MKAGPWESVARAQTATHRRHRLPRATSMDTHPVPVLTRWESAGSDLTLSEPQSPIRRQWLPLNVTSAWDSIQKTSQVENNSKQMLLSSSTASQPTLGMTTRVLLVIVYYYYHYHYYCNRTNPGPQSSGNPASFSLGERPAVCAPRSAGGCGEVSWTGPAPVVPVSACSLQCRPPALPTWWQIAA